MLHCLGSYILKLYAEQANWMFKRYLQSIKADNDGRGLQKRVVYKTTTRRLWKKLLSIAKFPVLVSHLTEAKGFIYIGLLLIT